MLHRNVSEPNANSILYGSVVEFKSCMASTGSTERGRNYGIEPYI